mmetsp:Transcript_120730/g.257874  ORF Transcript_120730/g.257874 Transcript_120730/m.257874 type:complete len:205 (+) Transcript_120730:1507-2121(+)
MQTGICLGRCLRGRRRRIWPAPRAFMRAMFLRGREVFARAPRAHIVRGSLRPPTTEAFLQAALRRRARRKPTFVLPCLRITKRAPLNEVCPMHTDSLFLGPHRRTALEGHASRHLQVQARLRRIVVVDVLPGGATTAVRRLVAALRRVPIAHDDSFEAHDLLQVLVEDVIIGASIGLASVAEAAGALHQVIGAHHSGHAGLHRG